MKCCPWFASALVAVVIGSGWAAWHGHMPCCMKKHSCDQAPAASPGEASPGDLVQGDAAKPNCCCKDQDGETCCEGSEAPSKARLIAHVSNDEKGDSKVPAVLSFTMNSLDDKPVKLAKYQGKVIVFVNVASKCGYTPQYKDLEALHEKYAEKGLAILGFPANEFGKQEPGSNAEIADFCAKKYGVKFDMFAKVVVKGQGQCDLYKYLTGKESKFPGDIGWNFEKFVVGRNGEIVQRFKSDVNPSSAEFVKVIEAELAK